MADLGFAEHGGWPVTLGHLMDGRSLTREHAHVTMAEDLDGAETPAQIAAFMVALRMKGETIDELGGMVDARLAEYTRVDIDTDGPVVDLVGTGGARAAKINVPPTTARKYVAEGHVGSGQVTTAGRRI